MDKTIERKFRANTLMVMGMALVMSACAKAGDDQAVTEIDAGYDPSVIRLSTHMVQNDNTRAGNSLQSTVFAFHVDRAAGVFVYKAGATAATPASASFTGYAGYANKKVVSVAAGGLLTLENSETLYFPTDKTAVDAYVYAPYTGSNDATVTSIPFSVSTTQAADGDYLRSDLVYGMGTAPFGGTASVGMSHALCKVTIDVKGGAGVNLSTTLGGIVLSGVSSSGTLNMTSGAVSTTEGSSDVIFSTTADHPVSAILPPQHKAVTIHVTYDGADYAATIPAESFNLTSGRIYNYMVTINATALTVQLAGITDWENGGGTSVRALPTTTTP